MTQTVAVVFGGFSAEREVSLETGKGVIHALKQKDFDVRPVDLTRDIPAFISALNGVDVVFNALHGRFGEDGCLQGLLDMLKIPYTHSGRLASALAMDKPTAKTLFKAAGLPVAKSRVLTRGELAAAPPLAPPYVIKPLNEGSSVGVDIIMDGAPPTPSAETKDTPIMVEEYVPGRELTVTVLDGEPLGVLELRPRESFYDYTGKYTEGKTDHLMPAPIESADYKEALRLAEVACKTLGCRGLARADLRFDETREGEKPRFALLEVNTQPGLTPLSLAPEIAGYVGIDFPDLVARMVQQADCEK